MSNELGDVPVDSTAETTVNLRRHPVVEAARSSAPALPALPFASGCDVAGSGPCCPVPGDALPAPVALVHGDRPQLADEILPLLRLRLGAAALIQCWGFVVLLGWMTVYRLVSGSAEPLSWLLFGLYSGLIVLLGACAVTLYRPWSFSGRFLRVQELLIFGGPTVLFLTGMYWESRLDPVLGDSFASAAGVWPLLIFCYGMLIPNTWQRAAVVVGLLATTPVLTYVVLASWSGYLVALLRSEPFWRLAAGQLVTGGMAVYGVHLIGRLRREAFEARQFGQYCLTRRLGAGGMGEVYLAEHCLLKRPCAIKIIRPGQEAADPKLLARFEREVRATARLSHWNTIEIFDYGQTHDGTFYYVMEYLPGLNLDQLVEQHGPMPAGRVIYLLRQVCQALREAHQAGLIHRDLKPSNIFAAQRGGMYDVAKLLDFGLVKPVAETDSSRLTKTGIVAGTPWFMSPEQGTGERPIDPRSDLYSLGCVAYFMLTAHAPFESANPIQVLIAHARDPVPPPSQVCPELPRDLEAVILRCLEKAPEDRFASAEELEAAFARCQDASRWTQADAVAWWRRLDSAAAITVVDENLIEARAFQLDLHTATKHGDNS